MRKRQAVRLPLGTIAIVTSVGKPMYFVANGKARMPWMKIDTDPRNLTLRQIKSQWRYSGVDSGTMRLWRPRIISKGGAA